METQIVAKTLIIINGDMGLLLRRSEDDEHRPGELDLPGGEIEAPEKMQYGAAREVREETHLRFRRDDMQLGWTEPQVKQRKEGPRNVVKMLYFLNITRKAGVRLRLSFEHDAYEIAPIGEIAERLDHPEWSRGIRYIIDNVLDEQGTRDSQVA